MRKLITVTEKKVLDIDIKFPIYRKHDVSGDTYSCVYYTKVFNEKKQISISEHRGGNCKTYEIELSTPSFSDSEDYVFGKGFYKSSKEEFDNAVNRFKAFIEEGLKEE